MGSKATAKARSIIYLVRHGECMGNIVKKNLGPEISILTEKGKQQAKLLGVLQKNVKFTQAYSSNTARAFETAKIIISESAVAKDLPIFKNDLLRERHLGILEGKDHAAMKSAIIESGKGPLGWFPEGGETKDEIEGRIENFLQEIFATVDRSSEAHTILAVSHSYFLLHAFKYLSETPKKYLLKNWAQEYTKVCQNTGYFKVAIQKGPLPREPRELEILTAHGNEHLKTLTVDLDEYDKLFKHTQVAVNSKTKIEI